MLFNIFFKNVEENINLLKKKKKEKEKMPKKVIEQKAGRRMNYMEQIESHHLSRLTCTLRWPNATK